MAASKEVSSTWGRLRHVQWVSVLSWLGVLGIAVYRIAVANQASFPGHADRAFYFTTAKSIAAGDGFDIAYIWHYLVDNPDLTHFAFDYWLPGGSFANALGILVIGPQVSATLLIATAAALGLAVVTFLACRQVGLDEPYPSLGALTVSILIPVSTWAVQSEPILLYAVAVVGSLIAMAKAKTYPRFWLAAGAAAGLAHAVRTDGLILLATGLFVGFLWRDDTWSFLRYAGLLMTPYLVVMSPILVMNQINLGRPLPTATVGFVAVTSYEDIYSANPIPPPTVIEAIQARVDNAVEMFLRLVVEVGPEALIVLGALVLVGVLRWVSSRGAPRQPLFTVAGVYFAGLILVHGIIVPTAASGGTWEKTFPSWLPVVVVVAMAVLATLPRLHRIIAGSLIGALVVLALLGLPDTTVGQIAQNNAVAEPLGAMEPTLEREEGCLDRDVVVMTRDPWEFSEFTERPSLQIPNDDLDTILRVANRYQATHLILPAPRESLSDREALEDVYGFEPVGRYDGSELLRFPGLGDLATC